MKSLLLVCALLVAAAPAIAGVEHDPAGPQAAQHGIDGDRAKADRQDAKAASLSAAGKNKAAQNQTNNANTTRADIAADLAGCGTCH